MTQQKKSLTIEASDKELLTALNGETKKVRLGNNIHYSLFFFYRQPGAKRGNWKVLKDWARIKGLKFRTVYRRINVHGYTLQEALEKPVVQRTFNIGEYNKLPNKRRKACRTKRVYKKPITPHVAIPDKDKK